MSDHKHHTPGHAVSETAPMNDPPDAWHDHRHDAEKPQHAHGEVGNAKLIIGVGLLAFVLVGVSVVAIKGYYIHYTTNKLNEQERSGSKLGVEVWEKKLQQRDTEMSQYIWADHTRVQIPREQGVAKVIEEYKKQASQPR